MPQVLPGKSVTTLRGMVGGGGNVEARDFTGGAKTIERLQSLGALAPSVIPAAKTTEVESPEAEAPEAEVTLEADPAVETPEAQPAPASQSGPRPFLGNQNVKRHQGRHGRT